MRIRLLLRVAVMLVIATACGPTPNQQPVPKPLDVLVAHVRAFRLHVKFTTKRTNEATGRPIARYRRLLRPTGAAASPDRSRPLRADVAKGVRAGCAITRQVGASGYLQASSTTRNSVIDSDAGSIAGKRRQTGGLKIRCITLVDRARRTWHLSLNSEQSAGNHLRAHALVDESPRR